MDGHSAHGSRAVRYWLNRHTDDIELRSLPPHAPELNPTSCSTPISSTACRCTAALDQAQPATETRPVSQRRQRQPHIVRRYFGGPHVRHTLEENNLKSNCASPRPTPLGLTRSRTSPCCGISPWPTPITAATRHRPRPCTATCGGATPKPATPTYSPRNARHRDAAERRR
ncbi:transposase [Streptomyces luteolifulvus]